MTKTQELQAACAAKGLRYVGTRGNTAGPICFVGEAPGADEDQAGIPFCGASGRELDRMLSESGIDPLGNTCWWTNPYKTRPPDNKLDRLIERGIPLKLYEEQFYEELNQYKPTFIVPLGATPLGLLCPFTINSRTGHAEISKYRGSLLRSPHVTWDAYVLPAYHPAFLFRAWAERQIDVLCFSRLREEYEYWASHNKTLQPLPERKLVSDPPADDAIDYLRAVLATSNDTIVSIDIENIGRYRGKQKASPRSRIPYVIGFSIDPAFGISIGLGEYDTHKTVQIWQLINNVLSTKRQVGQNYLSHDVPWLQFIGFDVAIGLCEDTLVRHHTLWPELDHKLDFQTAIYTREPYYKSEGKEWSVKERLKLKAYNCKDVCVTLEIYHAQELEFNQRA